MKETFLKFSLVISVILSLGTNSLLAESGKSRDEIPPFVEHTPYTTTRVSYDTTYRELALRYYGDASDYMIIFNANVKRLGKSQKIRKHTEVIIPVTEKFRDQPEHLGWN
jgi:hypothetical protein